MASCGGDVAGSGVSLLVVTWQVRGSCRALLSSFGGRRCCQ